MINTYNDRAKPITRGTWEKIARQRYRHMSGIEVKYDCNAWAWEIVGGSRDGEMYKTLNVSQYYAVKQGG